MSRRILYIFRNNTLILLISVCLFLVPFFWFKPDALNIGGDGGRLYFYDPLHILVNLSSYAITPFGTGAALPLFMYLPLITILLLFKLLFSSYVLIALYSGLKIMVSFLAVYGIVREISRKNNSNITAQDKISKVASILAGLFYVFNPAMTENYVRALPTHDQVFLNPLIFYLILRYINTNKLRFLIYILIVSLSFAHNFQTSAAPPFFAFFPLGLAFLVIYSILYKKINLAWINFLWIGVLFIGLHAFHLIPEFADFFTSGSNINYQVFDKVNASEMLGYFYGVMPYTKVSLHWLAFSATSQLKWLTVIIPLICISGFIFNKNREKALLLTGLFFLITLYLVTAQITQLGILIYTYLFRIPGFTMFKNFYGQWQFVFYFYYALLFGQAIYLIFNKISLMRVYLMFVIISIILVTNSWQFINGDLINQFNVQSNTKVGVVFDPKYEESLDFIRKLPNDGKILVLPFTDSYFQVVHGTNNGAYTGHSMIGQLTGKKDFAGYMDMAPYSDIFWKFSKEQRYSEIPRIFGLLNIIYVYHNSDPLVYDSAFPGYPYSPDYVRNFMPKNQVEYKNYLNKLPLIKIFDKGTYVVYKLDDSYIVPHFYVADQLSIYTSTASANSYNLANDFMDKDTSPKMRTLYLDLATCRSLNIKIPCDNSLIPQTNIPNIQFKKINPTKYTIKVFNATNPYFLVFSEKFHNNWKIAITGNESGSEKVLSSYFNGKISEVTSLNTYFDKQMLGIGKNTYLKSNSHFMVNGFANAWYITPADTNGKPNYELSIEFVGQTIFYWSLLISGFFSIILVAITLVTIKSKTF